MVLSGPAISSEKLKEAKETEKAGDDPDFNRPFLRLVFTNTGEFKHWSARRGARCSAAVAVVRPGNSSCRTAG